MADRLGPARAHGTNCTGIIAAVANNNIGIAGVAPDSKIIPINLAAANGAFTTDQILRRVSTMHGNTARM